MMNKMSLLKLFTNILSKLMKELFYDEIKLIINIDIFNYDS